VLLHMDVAHTTICEETDGLGAYMSAEELPHLSERTFSNQLTLLHSSGDGTAVLTARHGHGALPLLRSVHDVRLRGNLPSLIINIFPAVHTDTNTEQSVTDKIISRGP
jgi:hypothetical protein